MTISRRLVPAAAAGIIALVAVAACAAEGEPPDWTFPPPGPAAEEPAPAASPSLPPTGEGVASPFPTGEDALPDVTAILVAAPPDEENRYEPETVAAVSGSRVALQFRNRSSVDHNLTFETGIEASIGRVPPGAMDEIMFVAPDPGDYRFICTIQPGMEGVLNVE